MNNPISLNSQDDSDKSTELVGVYMAWLKTVNIFCVIDDAGLYQDPPNHEVIKCQE
jgi:hypothetical protein